MPGSPLNLGSWLRAAHSLLAPAKEVCLACGRPGLLSLRLPGICTACAERVPWILKPRCRKCGRHVGCPDCARGNNEASALIGNRSAVAYNSEMRAWLGQYKYRGDEKYAEPLGRMLDHAYGLLKEDQDAVAKLGRKAAADRFTTFSRLADEARRHFGYEHGGWRKLLALSVSPQASPPQPWLDISAAGTGARRGWMADMLVPVPVSDIRLAERGFNQAERLARILSARRRVPVMELLSRAHHTGKQSFKGRAERLADMRRAFVPNPALKGAFAEGIVFSERSAAQDFAYGRAYPPLLKIIVVDDIYTTGSTVRACADTIRMMASSAGCRTEIYSLTWARS